MLTKVHLAHTQRVSFSLQNYFEIFFLPTNLVEIRAAHMPGATEMCTSLNEKFPV
jgi:hypothetical protein